MQQSLLVAGTHRTDCYDGSSCRYYICLFLLSRNRDIIHVSDCIATLTWLPHTHTHKCGLWLAASTKLKQTELLQGVPDNQICSVSGFSVVVVHWPFLVNHTANRSLWSKPSTIWLITKPLTEELIQHVFCLHTHRVVGSIMFADCIGYCCV